MPNDSQTPTSEQTLLQQTLQQFENAWRDGDGPQLEAFLASLTELSDSARHEALCRLVQAEIQHRRRGGDSVDPADYRVRFPELDADQLDELSELPAPPDIRPPLLPSRYHPLDLLGHGGFGVVWRVRDQNLDRELAVKVLREEFQADREANARLEQEAVLTGSLQHPGVPPVVEQGRLLTGSSFFSMKLIQGQTLSQLFREREEANDRVRLMGILQQVARAVAFAHSQHVIHCDLKPHNVMVGQFGEVQLMDWGMARRHRASATASSPPAADADSPFARSIGASSGPPGEGGQVASRWFEGQDDSEQTGQLVGSPSYMAPEQALGRTKEIGPWTDVYALAGILYELLSGRPPARGDTVAETLQQVREREPIPIRQLQPDVPVDLETICQKGLARRPQDRYESAIALDEDLERFLQGRPILARPLAPHQRLWKWVRRHPTVAALIVVSAISVFGLTGLGVGAVFYRELQDSHDETLAEKERANLLRIKADKDRERVVELLDVTRGQKSRAERLQKDAQTQRTRAETAEQNVRRLLYAADIDLAQRAWHDDDVGEALARLDRHQPAAGDEDLRGFEWRYLKRLCDSARLKVDCEDALCAEFGPRGSNVFLVGRAADPVTIYDSRTGKPTGKIPEQSVQDIRFRPDGRQLAMRAPRQFAVYSYPDGERLLQTPNNPRTGNGGFSYSPNGERLAMLAGSDKISVYDSDSLKLVGEIKSPQTSERRFFRMLLMDEYVLAASRDGTLRQFDFSGQEVGTPWRVERNPLVALARSRDQRQVLTYSFGEVNLWDVVSRKLLATRKLRHRWRDHSSFPAVIRDIGDRFAFADGPTIQVCHSSGEDLTLKLRGHRKDVKSVALSVGAGSQILSTSEDGTVRLWDVKNAERESNLVNYKVRYNIEDFRSDGDQLALTRRSDGTKIDLWNMSRSKVDKTLSLDGVVTCARYLTDGAKLAIGSKLGEITVFDLKEEKVEARAAWHGGWIADIVFSPSEKDLAAIDSLGKVRIWRWRENRLLHEFAAGRRSGITFSPDGEQLATYHEKRGIELRSTSDWRVVQSLPTTVATAPQLAFTPDGGKLIAAGYSFEVWDAREARRILYAPRQQREDNQAIRLLVAPDGDRLFVTLNNGDCQVVDVFSGRKMVSLVGHASSVMRCLHLRPNGVLMTASDGGYLRTWNGSPTP